MERRPWTQRNRQLPRRFRDELPQSPQPLPPPHIVQVITSSQREEDSSTPIESVGTNPRRFFTTPYNGFGLARRFYTKGLPTYDPEENITLQDLSNIDPPTHAFNSSQAFYPYPNHSSFALGDWFWNGGVQKSRSTFRQLIDIICDADFRLEDVRDVKWDNINKELGIEEGEWLDEDAGWIRTPVTFSVPYQVRRGVPSTPHAGPRNFVIEDFFHKPLVSVVREKISHLKDTHLFHQEPYELLWQPSNSGQEPIRVQGELYSSPAFMDAYRELQDSPGESGCDLPRVIVALMFWSDATQLTSFGNTKLWPLYLFFGNDSKYLRCKPSCNLCEHVAYFQTVSLLLPVLPHTLTFLRQLPASFKEFAASQTAGGKAPSSAFMAHCHREFIHEQWKIILDDDFIEAWKHGIVVLCCDGLKRRFYLRIFTYSADYPEK